MTTSSHRHRLRRLTDMIASLWRHRKDYHVVQVDVFSGRAFIWAEIVCAELRLLGKPYVLTLHGGNLPLFARRWPGRVRRLLGSAAAVTTPSHFLHDEMAPYRRGLHLIPNGLELARYRYHRRERAGPQLVWLRAFHRVYNPTLAAEVLAKVLPEYPAARLVMVGPDMGDGSFRKTVSIAERLDLSSRLTLPGAVAKAQVPEWLDRGDIFLNTSTVDNAPVSVVEAMASGLCVVSTDVGGVPALLRDQHDALLVAPNDAEAMAAAVRRLLSDPVLASSISAGGRRKAESFDWALVMPAWERLLGDVSAGAKA